MTSHQESILIFCDGACSGNPGPGGWGAIVCLASGEVSELGGAQAHTTNNQMELSAAIEALQSIALHSGSVKLYTDSTYVIQGITKWIWAWKQRAWKTLEGNEVSNREYWEKLSALISQRGKENTVEWHYVRGHVGTPGNERVDAIAVAFCQHKKIELYRGTLKNYPFNLLQIPEDTSLPASSFQKKSKTKAYSYLSLVGNQVLRHSTWAECEARVKGVSSAKFKKAMSEEEEKLILQNWGVSL